MNVLVIYHVEPMWSSSFDETEEDYLEKIKEHLEETKYDQVIATSLEGDHYPEIKKLATLLEDWAYGWEDPEDESNHSWYEACKIPLEDIVPTSTHHQFTYIYPWIKALKNTTSVTLIGGAQYECLRDLEEALDYLGIEYKLYMPLVYG